MRKYREYSDEDITVAVQQSTSRRQVLEKLGLNRDGGGSQSCIKKRISELNLDISHWTGQLWSKGRSLKKLGEYKKKEGVKTLLIKRRGHKCECCGLTRWMERDITLEVHHIDGKRKNNVAENLTLLCPNCHSYTPNWRGRNRNKKANVVQPAGDKGLKIPPV